jgi:hypothetical protein
MKISDALLATLVVALANATPIPSENISIRVSSILIFVLIE